MYISLCTSVATANGDTFSETRTKAVSQDKSIAQLLGVGGPRREGSLGFRAESLWLRV